METDKLILVLLGALSVPFLIRSLWALFKVRRSWVSVVLMVLGLSILTSTLLTVLTHLNGYYGWYGHAEWTTMVRPFRLIPILSGYFFSGIIYLIFNYEKKN